MVEMPLADMRCGHCASVVTQTCGPIGPRAKFELDLGTKTDKVNSTEDRADFAETRCKAGYPPTR